MVRGDREGLFTPLPCQFIVDLSNGKMDTSPFVCSLHYTGTNPQIELSLKNIFE